MRPAETELHLQLKLSGSELTVNALIQEFERLEEQLFSALLDTIQREHLEAVRAGEAPPIRCPRCESERWVKRGSRSRQLKTSRGRLQFPLRQTTCQACGRTWSPFVDRLGLEPRQRASEELRRQLVGLVTELSYRKASRWGERLLGATLSPMTIWRTVQERGDRLQWTVDPEAATHLELDGTHVPVGPKLRGEPIHLAFAVGERRRERGRWRRQKRLVGVGFGPGSWPDALPQELAPELVVNDGERGLARRVAEHYPGARIQRCAWHLIYALDHQLWRDGWPKSDRDRLAGELHEHVFGDGDPRSRRARLRRWARQMFARGSPGRRYFERADRHIGHSEPSKLRTTAHAERAMRELNRRTDIGAPWSLDGIANLLRLRLARRHNPDDYARLWKDRTTDLTLEAHVS